MCDSYEREHQAAIALVAELGAADVVLKARQDELGKVCLGVSQSPSLSQS